MLYVLLEELLHGVLLLLLELSGGGRASRFWSLHLGARATSTKHFHDTSHHVPAISALNGMLNLFRHHVAHVESESSASECEEQTNLGWSLDLVAILEIQLLENAIIVFLAVHALVHLVAEAFELKVQDVHLVVQELKSCGKTNKGLARKLQTTVQLQVRLDARQLSAHLANVITSSELPWFNALATQDFQTEEDIGLLICNAEESGRGCFLIELLLFL
ncbi:hypothetical protein FR483_n340R [Paramecium bursaria Chlorella virus FR483]|uniref:Uncharacterized protein n340R n=1 Tax=Paramecium bursaria Chlorella virus FR483 TaxID=399781 RepID=A7J744_PBCVF|nr:hypothetical protein FR483_n340R [Paramecium bursaria Chlorella virus FR483]ABT15625.1 hypothetical protein FR483_n340R [Paramecium bursaria Chlorella virus FR483]